PATPPMPLTSQNTAHTYPSSPYAPARYRSATQTPSTRSEPHSKGAATEALISCERDEDTATGLCSFRRSPHQRGGRAELPVSAAHPPGTPPQAKRRHREHTSDTARAARLPRRGLAAESPAFGRVPAAQSTRTAASGTRRLGQPARRLARRVRGAPTRVARRTRQQTMPDL